MSVELKECSTVLRGELDGMFEFIDLKNGCTIVTPFIFDDGDHLNIQCSFNPVVKKWVLSDEGDTFLHLSVFMDTSDYRSKTRGQIIATYERFFRVTENEGALLVEVDQTHESLGQRFYDLLQCMLKVADVTFLKQERVASTFKEDFKAAMKTAVNNQLAKLPEKNITLDFDYNVAKDREQRYPIDCHLQFDTAELFVFSISSTTKCDIATISSLNFKSWQMTSSFRVVGIYEDQTKIDRRAVAMFSDVADKQVSSLASMNAFEEYLKSFLIV